MKSGRGDSDLPILINRIQVSTSEISLYHAVNIYVLLVTVVKCANRDFNWENFF